jgi:hypothetical protein
MVGLRPWELKTREEEKKDLAASSGKVYRESEER